MDKNDQTSQAGATPQEQGGNQPAGVAASPSGGTGPVQEQQVGSAPKTYTEEEVFRIRQSATDKARHDAQLEYRRQQESEAAAKAAEAERLRVERMDDEEYGQHMRQQQAAKTTEQQIAQRYAQGLSKWAQDLQKKLTERIPAGEHRTAFEKLLVDKGATMSPDDMIIAASDALTEAMLAKERAKVSSTAREAARKEATAEAVDTVAPELGTGSASTPVSSKTTSSRQLLSDGWSEAVAKAKSGH